MDAPRRPKPRRRLVCARCLGRKGTNLVPGLGLWQNVPNLNFNRGDRKLNLNANDCDNRNRNYAVPAFAREFLSERGAEFFALLYLR